MLSSSVANILILIVVGLIAELEIAKKALAEEKTVQLAADKSFAEEKVARWSADQSLWASEKAKASLNRDLLSGHASLTTIEEKLLSKSLALDRTVIKEHEVQIILKVTEEKMKAQEQQLELAQMMLFKLEFSSSTVANAIALVKNHMPEFDAEILQKDLTIDDAGWATLVHSA
jgi:hypothetical protein